MNVRSLLSSGRHEWQQMSANVAFQPHRDRQSINSSKMVRAAESAINRMLLSKNMNPSYAYQTLDSSAEYDEYQLAWHLLGYYVDCESTNSYGSGCPRQVLYAVYANPDYQGGGIGEYKYYDPKYNKYRCYGNGTCITKMDCHEANTQWKLLGVFKINNVSQRDGWMEQLFKHEGVCVWGWDTYGFASEMRQKMPTSCVATSKTLPDGSTLYYSTKPDLKGSITVGLYIDSMCSIEYVGNEAFDAFQLSGADKSQWSSFNEALDVYKICQPCISYNLGYDGFYCYDDAGYTNCNQCMKFSNKASCKVASQNDIALAAKQKGLISSSKAYDGTAGGNTAALLQTTFVSPMHNFPSLSASIVFCSLGLAAFFSTWRRRTRTANVYRRSSRKETISTSGTARSKSHSPRKASRSDNAIADALSYGLFPGESSTRSKKSSSKNSKRLESNHGFFAGDSSPRDSRRVRSKSTPNQRRREDALSDGLCDALNVFDKDPHHQYYSGEKSSKRSAKKSTLSRMFS